MKIFIGLHFFFFKFKVENLTVAEVQIIQFAKVHHLGCVKLDIIQQHRYMEYH